MGETEGTIRWGVPEAVLGVPPDNRATGKSQLISVIIPAYNAAPYIAETLDSVLRQTHPHREIIVVDDGSIDDTLHRLEPYRAAIHYIRQPNLGVGAARNAGLRVASGDYIAFLDADDVWRPEKLALQLDVATRHPQSGLIACDGVQFEGERILADRLLGGPLAHRLAAAPTGEITGRFYREMIQGGPTICCPSQELIPRSVADKVGLQTTGPDETQHWDYELRIALDHPITLHRDSLVGWRYHPTSLSGPLDRRHWRWILRQIGTLRRHKRLCAPEDRGLVADTLRKLVRSSAERAYDYGRSGQMADARTFLRRLVRTSRGQPFVLTLLVATWFPAALVHALARGLRSRPRFR
jgi:glycosyltransferase involved in cell wall biosynthesis